MLHGNIVCWHRVMPLLHPLAQLGLFDNLLASFRINQVSQKFVLYGRLTSERAKVKCRGLETGVELGRRYRRLPFPILLLAPSIPLLLQWISLSK
jgi:hypothetical protein